MIYKILELNAEINTWYRKSKYPNIVKKLISKYKRGKLKKMVNKYTDTNKNMYNSNEIYEFFSFAINRIDGKFMYIDNISVFDEKENITYFAELSFKDKNDRGICHFSFRDVKSNGLTLNIRLEDKRGTRTLQTIQCNGDGLLDTSSSLKRPVVDVIRGLNRMIADMINKMIYDEFDRSERIYDI